jgi:hypothetical protein
MARADQRWLWVEFRAQYFLRTKCWPSRRGAAAGGVPFERYACRVSELVPPAVQHAGSTEIQLVPGAKAEGKKARIGVDNRKSGLQTRWLVQ